MAAENGHLIAEIGGVPQGIVQLAVVVRGQDALQLAEDRLGGVLVKPARL